MAADEVPEALASTQEDLLDVNMISECVAGFKRIQEFVTKKSGQKQDKLFFQVKCVNGNQERPLVTNTRTAQELSAPNNSSNQMEHKAKFNAEDLRREEQAKGAPFKAQLVHVANPTVLQVTSTLDEDFQSVITVDSKAGGSSGTRGRTNLSRTVVESETGMLNLVKLANATQTGALSTNSEGIANSLKRDVASMEVPRKPRSKRSTTVVRLPGFTFQKLPDLLSLDEDGVRQSDDEEANPKDDCLVKSDSTVDVPRKLKNHISPKRVVVRDVETLPLEDNDRRFFVKNPRRQKPTTSLQVVNELFQEEYSSMSTIISETPKRKQRVKKAKMGRPRKARIQNAPIRGSTKKRSLRSVIQSCLRKRRGGTKRQKLSEGSRPQRVQRQQKMVYTQYHHSMRQLKDNPSLRFDKDVWNCPIITHLLTQKLIKVGDSVELLSERADPLFHGWFTSRGILCSNCGMVHSCTTFGACEGRSGSLDRLCVNDGITISKLLAGHDVVDSQ